MRISDWSSDLCSSDLDGLNLTCLGYSKSNLQANATIMDVSMKDNSTADMNLKCDSLNIDLQDKADARIYSVSRTSNVQLQKNAKIGRASCRERVCQYVKS